MSGKLDMPLEDLVKGQRRSRRGPVNSRRAGKPTAAPIGRIAKSTRATKVVGSGRNSRPVVALPNTGESKIVVSGLPTDVSELQIKEYFAKTIGPVKKVLLTYGPNGQSRGVATIIFFKSSGATEAATQLNGVKVDNRAMKIEVIVGAKQAAAVPIKTLSDRIAQPKNAKVQGKAAKPPTARTAAAAGKGRPQRGRPAGRGKPKSATELDAEMTDYFDGGASGATGGEANGAVNGAAQPVANGGDAMEDEIM